MNFEFKHGLIWISCELKYEGVELSIENCLLDTGSATTAIDMDLVNFNYDKPAKIKRLFGIGGGTQEVVSQEVEQFVIGSQVFKDVEIEFGDLQAELGINGFLGNDLLKDFTVLIDYKKHELQFM